MGTQQFVYCLLVHCFQLHPRYNLQCICHISSGVQLSKGSKFSDDKLSC